MSSLNSRSLFRQSFLVAAAFVAATSAQAVKPTPKPQLSPATIAPTSVYYGRSFSDWTVAWWQHMLSIPAFKNPLLDRTGVQALQAQSGPVVFIGGFWGGNASGSRYIEITPTTSLFFPVCAYVTDNGGYAPPGPQATCCTISELRCRICPMATNLGGLFATLDSAAIKGVSSARVISPAFDYDLPTGSLWETNGFTNYHFEGSKNAVADGYYVMLAPMLSGDHVLSFGVKGKTGVTYYIKVKGAVVPPQPTPPALRPGAMPCCNDGSSAK